MYTHYIDYLREEIVQRKLRNPRYSERAFAKATRLSPGFLKLVLQKKKDLSAQRAEEIAELLSWNAGKKRAFLDMLQARPERKAVPPEKALSAIFSARNGTYQGAGYLTRLNDGQKIRYEVHTKLSREGGASAKPTLITTEYVYDTGFRYSLHLQLVDSGDGTFLVNAQGMTAGNGYCVGPFCQIDVRFVDPQLGPFQSSVSFHFTGDRIVSTGRNPGTNTIFQHTARLIRDQARNYPARP